MCDAAIQNNMVPNNRKPGSYGTVGSNSIDYLADCKHFIQVCILGSGIQAHWLLLALGATVPASESLDISCVSMPANHAANRKRSIANSHSLHVRTTCSL